MSDGKLISIEPRSGLLGRLEWKFPLFLIAVFGLLGLAVSHLVSEEAIARRTPWITVLLGLVLIPYGLALLAGRQGGLSLLRPARGPRSAETWSVPVSYTHLTLPTNREV